jgi:hypothetical protein
MIRKHWFLRWTTLFGLLGLFVAAVLSICFFAFGTSFGEMEFWLWPSSLMFMALDVPSPAPVSTVFAIYAIAFAENAVLYAAVGVLTSPVVYIARRWWTTCRSVPQKGGTET